MKYSSILSIAGCALLLFSGCQKKSDSNMWDDNQTGAKYRNNSSSLWGSSGAGDLQSTSQDDFIALSDDDLKTQFADLAVAQPSHSLGEGGLPGADAFQNPTGELAAVFHPLFFNTDEHTLKSKESIDAIRSMAEYLKAHPHIAIIVEGHADERGPEAYNLSLGARRANYIRSLLVKQGVHANQVHTISFGKEQPFVTGHSPESWAQNRRAHFRVHSVR